jgi:hypothetical protein
LSIEVAGAQPRAGPGDGLTDFNRAAGVEAREPAEEVQALARPDNVAVAHRLRNCRRRTPVTDRH